MTCYLEILTSTIEGESPSSYITGPSGGEIIITVFLNDPINENPGNIGAAISTFANPGTTTFKRGHAVQDVNGRTWNRFRYYDISPDIQFRFGCHSAD